MDYLIGLALGAILVLMISEKIITMLVLQLAINRYGKEMGLTAERNPFARWLYDKTGLMGGTAIGSLVSLLWIFLLIFSIDYMSISWLMWAFIAFVIIFLTYANMNNYNHLVVYRGAKNESV